MKIAPIAVFAYDRPQHLDATLAYLKKNQLAKESEITIFCDGPKTPNKVAATQAVREVAKSATGFKKIDVVAQDQNLGLARSIITGVTQLIDRHGSVIVVEDDLVTSPFFLKYMNDALSFYEHHDSVASIHGYIYPTQRALPETFFLRGADCWGWATWKRAWSIFEADGKKLLESLEQQKLTHAFDLDGTYPYTQMLRDQISGKNNSWAIRWHASAFLKNKLTLYPHKSLVFNIGHDNSGTHCGMDSTYDVDVHQREIIVSKINIIESEDGRNAFKEFYSSQNFRPSFFMRVRRYVKRLL